MYPYIYIYIHPLYIQTHIYKIHHSMSIYNFCACLYNKSYCILSYTDWYGKRLEIFPQPSMDMERLSVLRLNTPQPSPDVASRCTVMVPIDAHHKLNWVKVPCDYPFSNDKAICKKPAGNCRIRKSI